MRELQREEAKLRAGRGHRLVGGAEGLRRTQFMAEHSLLLFTGPGREQGKDLNSTRQGGAQRRLPGRYDTWSLVRSVIPQFFISLLVGARPCTVNTVQSVNITNVVLVLKERVFNV